MCISVALHIFLKNRMRFLKTSCSCFSVLQVVLSSFINVRKRAIFIYLQSQENAPFATPHPPPAIKVISTVRCIFCVFHAAVINLFRVTSLAYQSRMIWAEWGGPQIRITIFSFWLSKVFSLHVSWYSKVGDLLNLCWQEIFCKV